MAWLPTYKQPAPRKLQRFGRLAWSHNSPKAAGSMNVPQGCRSRTTACKLYLSGVLYCGESVTFPRKYQSVHRIVGHEPHLVKTHVHEFLLQV